MEESYIKAGSQLEGCCNIPNSAVDLMEERDGLMRYRG